MASSPRCSSTFRCGVEHAHAGWRFSSSHDGWMQLVLRKADTKVDAKAQLPPGLSIATYNVWFDRRLQRARALATFRLFESLQPSVICLQEVTPNFLQYMCEDAYIRANYTLSDVQVTDQHQATSVLPYGVLMAVRNEVHSLLCSPRFTLHALPTRMSRSLLVLSDSSSLAIATVHLESLDNQDTRTRQLQITHGLLEPFSFACLCGDFNFDCKTDFPLSRTFGKLPIENTCLERYLDDYVDVWAALHDLSSEDRFTFDGSTNAWISAKLFGIEQMRYDRVLVRSSDQLTFKSIEMFGRDHDDQVGGCLSDHFGLLCRVERVSPREKA
mmetsp:Transcript_10264/g.31622  ORF Transcript_10264/g.31622 Transcript_10264/m.31622 type:complete len:328 (-) Transcript_10264:2503-3486(-)